MFNSAAFLEAFQSPRDRAQATHELARHGVDALPLLRAILDGEAKNEWGVAYRRLGMPVDCALVTISMLGALAKPLEYLVRQELAAGHPYATDALSAILGQPLRPEAVARDSERCGRPISSGRLTAVPDAVRCWDCQAEVELQG